MTEIENKCDRCTHRKVCGMPYEQSRGVCDDFVDENNTVTLTNYDKIRRMTVDELAEFIETKLYFPCNLCPIDPCECGGCLIGCKQWLESKVSEYGRKD